MDTKKRVMILVIICVVILAAAFIVDMVLKKNNKEEDEGYLVQISYSELLKKIDNKDTFVLLLSQTTCSHCADFKPKLREVANQYELEVYYLETNLLSKEDHENLNKMFSFDGTPTTIFVNNGEEKTAATRINGTVTKDKIIAKLKSNGFIE